MAKTLSQRIADRVSKEGKGATKKNRAIFLALRGEVEEAVTDGWPVKTIWETLHTEGRISFSYQAFRLNVNKLIVQSKKEGQAVPQVLPMPAVGGTQTVKQTTEPIKTKVAELPGFEFNTKPQEKDLI